MKTEFEGNYVVCKCRLVFNEEEWLIYLFIYLLADLGVSEVSVFYVITGTVYLKTESAWQKRDKS